MKTDNYTVTVPGDVYGTDSDALERLSDLAINEARERARIYAIPAQWSAKLVAGEVGDFEVTFRVTRKRN